MGDTVPIPAVAAAAVVIAALAAAAGIPTSKCRIDIQIRAL